MMSTIMEGDTGRLVKLAEEEIELISQELDLQSEKLGAIQQKLGVHRSAIYKTRFCIRSLRKTTGIRRYLLAVGGLGLLFVSGALVLWAVRR